MYIYTKLSGVCQTEHTLTTPSFSHNGCLRSCCLRQRLTAHVHTTQDGIAIESPQNVPERLVNSNMGKHASSYPPTAPPLFPYFTQKSVHRCCAQPYLASYSHDCVCGWKVSQPTRSNRDCSTIRLSPLPLAYFIRTSAHT